MKEEKKDNVESQNWTKCKESNGFSNEEAKRLLAELPCAAALLRVSTYSEGFILTLLEHNALYKNWQIDKIFINKIGYTNYWHSKINTVIKTHIAYEEYIQLKPNDTTVLLKISFINSEKISITVHNIHQIKSEQPSNLNQQFARYQSLFDNAPIGIFHFDSKGIITTCNDKFAQMIGSTKDQLIGYDLLNRIQNKELTKQISHAITTGKGYYEGKYSSTKANKQSVIRLLLKTIEVGDDSLKEVIGLLEDITEQNAIEESLKESTEKYKAQYENFPNPVYIWQKKGNDFMLVSANKAAYQDSDGKISELFHVPSKKLWADEPELTEYLVSCYYERKSFTIERQYTFRATGKTKYINARYGYLPPDSVQIITVDITEKSITEQKLKKSERELRKQNTIQEKINEELQASLKRISEINEQLSSAKDRAEDSDKLKSAFLANISHEIRTPMNGIIGFAQMLKIPGVNEEKRYEYIDIINNSGEKLLSVLNDIVDISKIEVGQVEIHIEEVSIKEIVEDVFAFHCETAWKKKLKFNLHLPDIDSENVIHTDVTKFRQVLSNLTSNAIKFTDNGQIAISYKKADHLHVFEVTDTGIGIAPEALSIIFHRFQQENSLIRVKYGGTGLGLAISKAYAKSLGGDIEVESEISKGSTFRFTLPDTQ